MALKLMTSTLSLRQLLALLQTLIMLLPRGTTLWGYFMVLFDGSGQIVLVITSAGLSASSVERHAWNQSCLLTAD